MKRTPWFDVSLKPKRRGMYEYMYRDLSWRFRAKWDGKKWTDPTGVKVYPLDGDKWRGVMR